MKKTMMGVALWFSVSGLGQSTDPVWVNGSSQRICQPNGEKDFETKQPTVSQTETNYGLVGNDLGASFEHNGKLWILFGDTWPTPTFNGKPNAQTDLPRTLVHNDAIAFTSVTDISQCLKLDYLRNPIGAYRSPDVLNAQGASAITLGDFEVPMAGIDVGGRMFVMFATDQNRATVAKGFSTRSVVAVSDDDGNTYHYLYDFSVPACTLCSGAKFVNVAIGSGTDNYLYFWGSEGGDGARNSPVFLARKLSATMAQPGGIQYFTGLAKDGKTPNWSASESDAAGLFQDSDGAPPAPKNCTGSLGVDYNTVVQRWVMLYNCLNETAANPAGVYMRFASQPWGPWGAPQTIFNNTRDRGHCFFMHRAVTPASPACDQASNAGWGDIDGDVYGPYFLSRFTTGDAASQTSTFYYLMSTWNPYVVVVMKTTIQSAGSTVPAIGLVANAEGESPKIAPNTWLEIKGSNLAKAGSGRIWQGPDFAGGKMPTQLDGVSVTVNGKAAFVYYISPTQVNVLTPPDAITSGSVQVVLNYNGAAASYSAPVQATSPSFFVFDVPGDVAATHADGSLIGPTTLVPGKTNPAKPGETIVLYANGFGPTSTPVVSGSVTQSGNLSPLPVVQIGGIAAEVTFAGLVSPGQYQFNVVVPPATPDGNQSIVATLNGTSAQGRAMLAVQH